MRDIERLERELREAGARTRLTTEGDDLCRCSWLEVDLVGPRRVSRHVFTSRTSFANGSWQPEVVSAFMPNAARTPLGRMTVEEAVDMVLTGKEPRVKSARERMDEVPACPGTPRLHRQRERKR